MIWLSRNNSALGLVPPVSWISGGRTKFALVAVVPILLLWPLFRMTGNRRIRFFGAAFLALIVALYAVWPFAASATNRRYLAGLPTRFDTNGICIQSTDYTCGPAAAVTALRHIGLRAGEGQIAIASHSSAAIGTPPDMLCRGLRSLYPADKLECDLRYFSKLEDLPAWPAHSGGDQVHVSGRSLRCYPRHDPRTRPRRRSKSRPRCLYSQSLSRALAKARHRPQPSKRGRRLLTEAGPCLRIGHSASYLKIREPAGRARHGGCIILWYETGIAKL